MARTAARSAAAAAVLWYLTWLGVGIDCRLAGGPAPGCWRDNPLTPQIDANQAIPLLLAGLGVGGAAGGILGYNTYNPTLRDPRQPPTS
jgi:hypothetical protein